MCYVNNPSPKSASFLQTYGGVKYQYVIYYMYPCEPCPWFYYLHVQKLLQLQIIWENMQTPRSPSLLE